MDISETISVFHKELGPKLLEYFKNYEVLYENYHPHIHMKIFLKKDSKFYFFDYDFSTNRRFRSIYLELDEAEIFSEMSKNTRTFNNYDELLSFGKQLKKTLVNYNNTTAYNKATTELLIKIKHAILEEKLKEIKLNIRNNRLDMVD